MFYIIFKDFGIDILKCSGCKSYDIELKKIDLETDLEWSVFEHSCLKCGKSGKFRIRTSMQLEKFDAWDGLQERVEELKALMAFKGL